MTNGAYPPTVDTTRWRPEIPPLATALCRAARPSRITSLHDGPSSATYPELQNVSPPYSGPVRCGTWWLDLIRHVAVPKLDLRKRAGIQASCSVIVND
ncbi:hypothetical protein CY34DRAFT_808114 [Suillus luteus UH-Slu-Lm8-n1]|uniref:Uncharacterized protein n=1 Tax=Suillus luteus UH-Slu-Lm8-n1 TaxID=930992 RepID=A0A0D0AZ42_9AGAM|nr:hypothetical protein CY34DRAFT_808114 [Suillus luteus UH-Slu-Lm8-n1]